MKTRQNGRKGAKSPTGGGRRNLMRASAEGSRSPFKIGARENHIVMSGSLDSHVDFGEVAVVLKAVSKSYADITIDASDSIVVGDDGLRAWLDLARKHLAATKVRYTPASELSFLLMHCKPYLAAHPSSEFADPYS
jgi:hypothetical protein